MIQILISLLFVAPTYPETQELSEGELICSELIYRNEPHLQEAFNTLNCEQGNQ